MNVVSVSHGIPVTHLLLDKGDRNSFSGHLCRIGMTERMEGHARLVKRKAAEIFPKPGSNGFRSQMVLAGRRRKEII